MRLRPPCTLAALLLLSLSAGAQAPLHRFQGDKPYDWFGVSVAVAGDVNADGFQDFIIGASQNLTGYHGPDPGYARVYSGQDLSLLYEWSGEGTDWTDGPDDHFGHSVAGAGDVDGDGYDDLIVGAYKDDDAGQNAGEVYVFSGQSGALIHHLDGDSPGDRFAYSATGMGDVDGDGKSDLLIGVYKDDHAGMNAGSARVLSGADASILYEVHGDEPADALGWTVDAVDDLTGDGITDLVAGAMQLNQQGKTGYARVYSGADGSEVFTVRGDASLDHLGWSVAGLGDLNGDGKAEFAVGAPQMGFGGVPTGNGYARVYSGADAAVLYEVGGSALGDGLGMSVADAGDVDGDGVGDFIVGAPRMFDQEDLGIPGYVRVYSGATGVEIQRRWGDAVRDLWGFDAAGGFDFNGDGYGDLLVGAPEDYGGSAGPGYVDLHLGICNPPPEHYCAGAPNSVGDGARIGFSGSVSVEVDNLSLRAEDCPVNHYGIFFYGGSPAQIPFGDGYRCITGEVHRMHAVSTGSDGIADYDLDLDAPPTAAAQITPGSTWFFQFWYRDPFHDQSGFNLSDGLRLSFCP